MFSFTKKNEPNKPVIRKSIPALILNKDWHNLFPQKKPSKIKATEKKLESLIKKYSQTNQSLKDYESLKKQLMDGIIADMENISEDSPEKLEKKMNTNTNLIYDLNHRMEEAENNLLELPALMDECNKELIFETAEVFYPKLMENTKEYVEINKEIAALKKQLRLKLERKVDLEEENDRIYRGLHQVLGAEILDQMDAYFIGQHGGRKSYDLKGQFSPEASVFLSEETDEEA